MRKWSLSLTLTAVFFILSSLTGYAKESSTNRQEAALSGLDGVEVVVTVSHTTPGSFLNAEQIRNFVNQILSKNGVPVITRDNNPKKKVGLLRFHLSLAPRLVRLGESGGLPVFMASLDTTCGISVEAPNLDKPTFAVLWSTGGIAMVSDPTSPVLGQGLVSQATEFIEDFKSANNLAETAEHSSREMAI